MDKYKVALDSLKKIAVNDPTNNCEEIFCKLHDTEHLGEETSNEDGTHHNCLACQLNDHNGRILRFLQDTDTSSDGEYSFTIFILLLYLQVEKLTVVFKTIGITLEYIEQNWKVLIEIRKWANFVKHPKGFLFTHHPSFLFETDEIPLSDNTKVLDYKFVEMFYSREDENKLKENIKQLKNKKNVLVVIPCPDRLVREYSKVCEIFCTKIKDNPHFKEILKTHSTLLDY